MNRRGYSVIVIDYVMKLWQGFCTERESNCKKRLLGCACIFCPGILNHLGGKIYKGQNNGMLGSLF